MKMKLAAVSFAVFLGACVGEYRKLIPKCANSCLTNGESNQPNNCFCDSKCSLVYNDCCLDAPTRTIRVTTKRSHNINCVFVHGENRNFWMVDTCKGSWTGHDHVREKCTTGTDAVSGESSDIIGALPVTDAAEGVTYKNYYCSLCNGVRTDLLIEWQLGIDAKRHFLFKNINPEVTEMTYKIDDRKSPFSVGSGITAKPDQDKILPRVPAPVPSSTEPLRRGETVPAQHGSNPRSVANMSYLMEVQVLHDPMLAGGSQDVDLCDCQIGT
ncbi:hypothetical protein JTE90_012536 [Oedothorax gibbosus]|uniref:SMB domain-containing protein n=1 Tax=Oedothorax gibbosus TaxID=931172 RepID=A0AAV6U3T1_9ARAC|nr:hypothetical protein JTE90_012536 [Oedothorax gibbosus]